MKKTWVRFLSQEDSPEEGNGNPVQSSCLEKPTDRGGWRMTVHGAAKESDVTWRLNNHHHITAPLVFCPSSLVPGSMPAWILPWSLYLALAGPDWSSCYYAAYDPGLCEVGSKIGQGSSQSVPTMVVLRLFCSRLPMSLPSLPPSDWDPTNLFSQRFLMVIC